MEGLLREGLLDHEVAGVGVGAFDEAEAFDDLLGVAQHRHGAADHHAVFRRVHRRDAKSGEHAAVLDRSEEHTPELQTLMRTSYAVFCLKKKKEKYTTRHRNTHITIKN